MKGELTKLSADEIVAKISDIGWSLRGWAKRAHEKASLSVCLNKGLASFYYKSEVEIQFKALSDLLTISSDGDWLLETYDWRRNVWVNEHSSTQRLYKLRILYKDLIWHLYVTNAEKLRNKIKDPCPFVKQVIYLENQRRHPGVKSKEPVDLNAVARSLTQPDLLQSATAFGLDTLQPRQQIEELLVERFTANNLLLLTTNIKE